MGRTNERIARIQETYVTKATSSWLEGLERSLAQMKEYQVSIQVVLARGTWGSESARLLGRSLRTAD